MLGNGGTSPSLQGHSALDECAFAMCLHCASVCGVVSGTAGEILPCWFPLSEVSVELTAKESRPLGRSVAEICANCTLRLAKRVVVPVEKQVLQLLKEGLLLEGGLGGTLHCRLGATMAALCQCSNCLFQKCSSQFKRMEDVYI